MATYTIEVTDNGDVPAVANGGVASIVVTDATAAGGGGGGVTSVNGKVGVVTISASDVGAATSAQGVKADSAVQPGDIGTAATHAATDFETAGAAAAALVTAEAYTDAAVAGIGGGGGGAVASVNGQTGAVVLTASDVGADAAGAAAAAQAASQPVDSDLTAIAALTTTTFGRAFLTLADAAAARSAIGAGTSSFDGAYASLTGKPTLGTAAAAATGDFDAAGAAAAAQAASQPLDSDLTAIAALATTTFGRSLLTQADAAAVRTLIGAGTSSLALGTSSSTAKAGDYQPTAANISDSTTIGRTVLTAADAAAVRTAIGAGTSSLAIGTTGTTAAAGNDSRLSDARTPTAHASSHASAGSDPLTIAESQVTNLTSDLAAKAPLASPTFTGTPAAPTVAGTTDSTTKLATTAFVQAVAALLAPLASPALTGNPTAPTQTAGNNSTRLATTAYTDAAVAAGPIDATKVTHTIQAQTGTTYTLVLGDAGKFVTMTNASASTLTVPPNSSVAFPVGTQIEGAQLGAGQVTLTPGAGVTINATPGLKVAAQYGTFGLLKTATDTWLAYGRLSA